MNSQPNSLYNALLLDSVGDPAGCVSELRAGGWYPLDNNISIGTEEKFGTKDATDAVVKHGMKDIVFFESQRTAHEGLTWRRSLADFAPRLFR